MKKLLTLLVVIATFFLSASSVYATPVVEPATVRYSGYVYLDSNRNSVKDAGEAGLMEVEVSLYNTSGDKENAVGSTITDFNGYWQIDTYSGKYTVVLNQEDLGSKAKRETAKQDWVDSHSSTMDIPVYYESTFLDKYWVFISVGLVLLFVGLYLASRKRAEILNQ